MLVRSSSKSTADASASLYPLRYNNTLFHAWEMHRLKPDIETKKFLLFFYNIPERLLPLETALHIANEIIKADPDYKPALEILSR